MIKNTLTGSIPLICHFPGKSYKKKYSKIIFDYMLNNINTNINIPETVDIVSVKTCDDECLLESQLKQKAGFFCIKASINQRWKHINKIKLLIQYIEQSSQNRPYILFLDAYDVIINDDNLTPLSTYDIKDNIIFNAEKNFYSTLSDIRLKTNIQIFFNTLYPNSNYPYLNTGCFFGHKNIVMDRLLNLLKLVQDKTSIFHDISCDQTAIQLYWYLYDNITKINKPIIKLDNDCQLFMCMNYMEPKDIEFIQ